MNINQILKGTRLTEKTYVSVQDNKYVFNVASSATKFDIKKAVEEVFEVEVMSVKTLNIRTKRKTGGKNRKYTYVTDRMKKAIVEVKTGQTIKLFDEIFNDKSK